MTNFITRTVSGAVFVAILISSIWFSPYVFAAVFAIISALAVREFHKITNNGKEINVNVGAGMLAAVVLFLSTFVRVSGIIDFSFTGIYILIVLLVSIAQLFLKQANPIQNWAFFILGQVFVALPFSMLNHILYVPDWQPSILLALFVTIWMNDSWAYVFGVSFGKHKMFERVSPKKSWEGFIGGVVMSLLTGVLCWYVIPMLIGIEWPLWKWLLFAETVVVFGTLGDLMESLLKRTVGIKDSGKLIPGHGGLLDRFDSMLLAAPAIYVFLLWFT